MGDEGLGVSVRPRTGQIQTKSSTALPLEYFDSPEMELISPEERLARGSSAGAAAGSTRSPRARAAAAAASAATLEAISEGAVEEAGEDEASGPLGKDGGAAGGAAAAGGQAVEGVLGYSRFYTADGSFRWTPCRVMAYDRWVSSCVSSKHVQLQVGMQMTMCFCTQFMVLRFKTHLQ